MAMLIKMWGHNPDYDNYWPEYESEYRPVPGWHGPRRHRMDLTLPGPYGGGPRRMFRPDLLSTPHAAPRQLAPPFRPRAPVSQERSNAEKLYQDFNDPARPSPIAMEYQASAVKCEVSWRAPVLHRSIEFVYRVDAAQGTQVETMELGPHKTLLRMKTTPGQWYTVEVRAVTAKPENRIVAFGSVQFKAVFSREEMLMLHKRAVEFVGTSMHPFRVIYRCKPKPYFDDIRYRTGAIMEKYLKDNNGQAASSINGVISGLFFSARLLPDGSLPLQSPFGDIRMVIPAPTILDPGRVRMYFSDFYCNYITHYVTVVICERGSETDRFCERRLIPLSPENNPFLRIIPRHDVFDTRYEYWVNKNVWVEIYYTEHVPLSWGMFDTITATGAGTSKPGGLPHNKTCQQCNLYPVGRPAADAHASQMAERKRAADEAGEDTDDILSMVKRPRMRDEKDFGDDIADINSTFHLVMEMERERLLAEGASADALLEPGNVDMIEVVCSLIDSVIEIVGDTIVVPEHGFVGSARRKLPAVTQGTANQGESTGTGNGSDAKKTGDFADGDLSALLDAAKENLKTSEAAKIFDHLKSSIADLDQRCRNVQQTLTSLQGTIVTLEKKIKTMH